jgi:hypothetical protein
MTHPELELALKRIGVDLSTLPPSERTFLIESTARLLRKHDLEWIEENSHILHDRFDLLKSLLQGSPSPPVSEATLLFASTINNLAPTGVILWSLFWLAACPNAFFSL